MNILFTGNQHEEVEDITEIIRTASINTKNTLTTWNDVKIEKNQSYIEILNSTLSTIDLVIVHLTKHSNDVNVEIGFAIAKGKPIILICPIDDISDIAANLFTNYIVAYDKTRINETILKPLSRFLKDNTIESFMSSMTKEKIEIKTVFVSYSHVDSEYLERLKIHMKPFEKKGLIEFWSDTKIKAGDKWRDSIEKALDKCVIAILLISADFLASDFIIDNELPPLLKGAEEKGKIILPVILKPCRFTKEENLSVFQSINNPSQPLSKMNESEREETYVKIADTIDSLI